MYDTVDGSKHDRYGDESSYDENAEDDLDSIDEWVCI